MKIGIIGAGNAGTGLAKRLADKGHDVVISFARTPARLAEAAKRSGSKVRSGTPDAAAKYGDVVIIATPWDTTLGIVKNLASSLVGKIVWDATNPLKKDMSGLALGTDTSGGEEIAKLLPGAKVVKAVPPFAEVLHSASTTIDGEQPSVFVASDDAQARSIVAKLVEEAGGSAVEAGPLSLARYTEPLGMLLVQLAYVQGFGARIGVVLIHDSAESEALPETGVVGGS